jgi:hypothetical protein
MIERQVKQRYAISAAARVCLGWGRFTSCLLITNRRTSSQNDSRCIASDSLEVVASDD